jgi:hypothetical protein
MLDQLIPEFGNIYVILQVLSFVLFIGMFLFFPRIMIWQANRKLRDTMIDIESYKQTTEELFLDNLTDNKTEALEKKFNSMKDFKVSAPSNIDPAGAVERLEHVLDTSEDKFNRFVKKYADTEDEDELANLNMTFKGVMGTNQIYKVVRHFKQLVNKTGNIQIISMVQMTLPIYKELAESQKEASRAFADEAPIGDSIGPMVAARLIENEEPEEISEDIVHSEEEIDGQEVHVLKSKGPGARLGKYGDAIDQLSEDNDLEAIVTVDAASKFEGETTGDVAEGVGVMMGGPGVEKTKIEDVATEHDVPLEGVVIKQSAPEASKAMKKEIYEAHDEAEDKARELASEFDGPVAIVGVGNTVGIPNTREETSTVHNRLHKYWKEYEEQEEEEVSYMGIMGIMPGGDQQADRLSSLKDQVLWTLAR